MDCLNKNLGTSPRQNCPQRASIKGFSFLVPRPVAETNLEMTQLGVFFLRHIHVLNTVNQSSADPLNSSYSGQNRGCSQTLCRMKSTFRDYIICFSLGAFVWKNGHYQTRASLFRITATYAYGEYKGSLDLGFVTLKWTLENNLSGIFRENSLLGKRERETSNHDQLSAELILSHRALFSVLFSSLSVHRCMSPLCLSKKFMKAA